MEYGSEDEGGESEPDDGTYEQEGPQEEQAQELFKTQQHRIIWRLCLNAQVPFADAAKFHSLINNGDQDVISSFEVFALNRRERDFIENLNILADILAVKIK